MRYGANPGGAPSPPTSPGTRCGIGAAWRAGAPPRRCAAAPGCKTIATAPAGTPGDPAAARRCPPGGRIESGAPPRASGSRSRKGRRAKRRSARGSRCGGRGELRGDAGDPRRVDPPGGVRGCPLLCCRRCCAGTRGRRGGGSGGPAVLPGGAQSPVPGRGKSCVGSRWGAARGCSAPHRSTARCPSGRHPVNRPVEMGGWGEESGWGAQPRHPTPTLGSPAAPSTAVPHPPPSALPTATHCCPPPCTPFSFPKHPQMQHQPILPFLSHFSCTPLTPRPGETSGPEEGVGTDVRAPQQGCQTPPLPPLMHEDSSGDSSRRAPSQQTARGIPLPGCKVCTQCSTGAPRTPRTGGGGLGPSQQGSKTHQLEDVLIFGHDGELQHIVTVERQGSGRDMAPMAASPQHLPQLPRAVTASSCQEGTNVPIPTSHGLSAAGTHLFWMRAMTCE